MTDDRTAFLAAIREHPWDDDTPRLVYADRLADHGEHEAERRLRHSLRAWSAVQAVPADGPTATELESDEALRRLRKLPDADILSRLAAVAFCRRPCVWDRLTDPRFAKAVEAAQESADGLLDERELRTAHDAARFAYAARSAATSGGHAAVYAELAARYAAADNETAMNHIDFDDILVAPGGKVVLEDDIHAQHATGSAFASFQAAFFAARAADHDDQPDDDTASGIERGYQVRVCEALLRVTS